MHILGLNELRERFLKFFEAREHFTMKSFSLIPQNDKSLLLINSGMAPLKPYFTGAEEPPKRRITTCQKCIRTPDIDNVGNTARHGTFFEMLGNFSFGDYFKKEAISWAWEFVTEELEIPAQKLYISIYKDDDEAFEIWNNDIGIPEERIVRMGKKENFWEHGTGPCGPCSEIYFDRGEEKGCGKDSCGAGCDCDRFIEFWNLVFTQLYKDEEGNYTKLDNPNIDTGMGLERLAVIMQGVDNIFEVDTIKNILKYVCKISGVEYGSSHKSDISIRVITDHIRSTTMMISDGILPSNEGRGYVLRRLLRRAARHGKLLGISTKFLYDVAKVVIHESKSAYPELEDNMNFIQKVIKIEEERFEATVDQGFNILNEVIRETKSKGLKQIPGKIVFKLHDTYGFPFDLTREIANENNLDIDEKGFESEMKIQKQKAREALKNKGDSAWNDDTFSNLNTGSTEFIGYEYLDSNSQILHIVKENEFVNMAGEEDEVTIILNKTPFYAESGGQVGDTGLLNGDMGTIRVKDCKKTGDGKYLHFGKVTRGFIEKGSSVKAVVDYERRMNIQRNHTATHLLQKALGNNLGSHIKQAGSLVDSDRLRFDFTHFSPLAEKEIKEIEREVNEKIFQNLEIEVMKMTLDEAKRLGATALFGEKYDETVRVVKIGDYSMELCGGTHLDITSEAGIIKITSQSGVAAGVRRVEALTGKAAVDYLNKREETLNEVSKILKSSPEESVNKVKSLITELRNSKREMEKLKSRIIGASTDNILEKAIDVNGIKVIKARYDNMDMKALRKTADTLKSKMNSGMIVLASAYEEKAGFVITATKDVVERGINAGKVIKEVARIAGGGGGGRPDMAQAGGKDISKIDEALGSSINIIESMSES